MRVWKRIIAAFTAGAMLVTQASGGYAQSAQQPPAASSRADSAAGFTREDYEACQTEEEAAFRKAIRSITLAALKRGTASLDYNGIVRDQWRVSGFDRIIDQRVDIAVDQVREETAWSELLKSLAFRKQAQELAKAVAERTYRSTAVKAALEELATNVGNEIGRSIVITTADAAMPAQRCLQAYLGPRYGRTVAKSVNRDANAAFTIDAKGNQAQVSSGQVLLETSSGITGAVLLLVRRQMTRMAQRIGQRLVGSVLGRLVSVVAGGVGLVLIAKEFWELRHGVLPIVANEMKSADSKGKVREELAKSIREQIDAHLDELSARTADKIVDIWHDFRRAHAKVVQLAARDSSFKSFLDQAHPTQLPRLDEIVALLLDHEGEDAVAKRLKDGTLHAALNKMPPEGMQIAREQQSLTDALAWTSLAGDRLPKVVQFDIHKHAKPDSFSKASLSRMLTLDDRLSITRIAGVGPDARNVLLELESEKLVSLARTLTQDELGTLSRYLTGLKPDASQRVLRVVSAAPSKMRNLASVRVRDAILGSRDQAAAVGMMLSEPSPLDVITTYRHSELVWAGEVSPILIWDKHPGAVIVLAALLLVLLVLLRGLLFGRRRSKQSKEVSA